MMARLSLVVALAVITFTSTTSAAPPSRGYNGTHTQTPHAQPTSSSQSSYKQVAEFAHPNFFDGFTFFTEGDPTLGSIEYVDREVAKSKELLGWVYYEDQKTSNAYVGLDHQGKVSHRPSVRLISKQKLEPGSLTVIDVRHVPTGPALWPAVWFLAPAEEGEWPGAGEIDVMEWVNDLTYNAMTLHTGPGCVVDRDPSAYLGTLGDTDCNSGSKNGPGTVGCSIKAPNDYSVNGKKMATTGPAFNAQGGGVYVHEWTAEGMSVWLFPRHAMPADLRAGKPDPTSWTQKPLAKFSGKGCDFTTAFKPQQLIINIDLCGQWAGDVFPGGWDKCNAFVENNPSKFEDAFFDFASIRMYSSNGSGKTHSESVEPESVEPESCDE